jgi:hypothetical protein
MASPAGKFNGIHRSGINSKIGFRSIHVVGEANALSLRSTPTTGSFIFREDQQRANASFGDPCNDRGALTTLKKGTPDLVRADNAIALARVGVNLKDEKPARFVAQAVYAILSESK